MVLIAEKEASSPESFQKYLQKRANKRRKNEWDQQLSPEADKISDKKKEEKKK
jgi:hypothetical protein